MARSGKKRRLAAVRKKLAAAKVIKGSRKRRLAAARKLAVTKTMKSDRKRKIAAARKVAVAKAALAGIKPLKVLFLGRLNPRRSRGGIAKSAYLISDALRRVGDEVILVDSRVDQEVPKGTDIVVHYSDLEGIDGHIARAKAAGVPIVINASYDGTQKRVQWISKTMRVWMRAYPRTMMFVFSQAARNALGGLRSNLVVLPKTIRAVTMDQRLVVANFEQREGICLGELEKARRRRIVGSGALNAEKAVKLLQAVLPGVPLYFYNQYVIKGKEKERVPAGAKVQGYMRDGFVEWLEKFRLYISLSQHETFAMVPCEAQSVGTVVLYRSQPQSLNEQLSHTAVSFDNGVEMAMAAKTLYYHQQLWSMYSTVGRWNAESRDTHKIGAAFDIALRKAILAMKGKV